MIQQFKYVASICLCLLITMSCSNRASRDEGSVLINEFIYDTAPFPSAHASTVVSTPSGLIAAWFGGTHEKHEDVEIWVSRRLHGEWTSPVSVANGILNDTLRVPSWNPVLFQLPSGELQLYYKLAAEIVDWWGMVITSSDDGETWSEPRRLPDGILGPIKNKPVLLSDGTTILSPSSTEHDGWIAHIERSTDSGQSWEFIGPLNSKDLELIQPSVLIYGNGDLQLLCRSRNDFVFSSWSYDDGLTWTQFEATSLPNPNSGTDAVSLSNGLQLLVYNHTKVTEGKWGGPRSPLNIALSKDGKQWKAAHVLESEEGEFSYPSVVEGRDGKVHVVYTWNRERIKYVCLDINQLDFDKLKDIEDGQWPVGM